MLLITENAKHKIMSILSDKPSMRLRVSVDSGGCSGFKYNYVLDDTCMQDDQTFFDDKVVVDEISLSMLQDSHLDYIEDLGSAEFIIQNPHARAKCGCGQSFST